MQPSSFEANAGQPFVHNIGVDSMRQRNGGNGGAGLAASGKYAGLEFGRVGTTNKRFGMHRCPPI
jgi:hypothetical protein